MIELLQLWSMIVDNRIYCLILFLLIFVMAPVIIMRLKARRYQAFNRGESLPVSVIIPVYKEDYGIFKACLESIARQHPGQMIVSIDSGDGRLIEIAKSFGAEVIEYPNRIGKRQAIADAWLRAQNDIIVHVDSDVTLAEDCLKEITKPFKNERVAGVSSRRIPVRGKSFWAWSCSSIVELNSNVNAQALNGGLVVVDGRCNAWRKKYLLSVREKFLKDVWWRIRGEIGEDRFLSRNALKKGYQTVFQGTARVFVITPDSLVSFLKQQLRWRLSGVKFFLMDLVEGVRPSRAYVFRCVTYYLAPFAFAVAIILDVLYFHLPGHFWSSYWIPLIVLTGATAVTTMRQSILLGKPFSWLYLPLQAIIGLILLFPIAIYGTLTFREQSRWVTRAYAGERGSTNALMIIIIALVGVVLATLSVLGFFFSDHTAASEY